MQLSFMPFVSQCFETPELSAGHHQSPVQPKEDNPAATGDFTKGLPLKDGDNPDLPLLIEKTCAASIESQTCHKEFAEETCSITQEC